MQWETEAPGVYSAEAEPVMAEEEPVIMAEEEPAMEQAPPSLAAEEREAPVFGKEVMEEEAAAEEPYGEVPEETSAVEGVVVEGVAAPEDEALLRVEAYQNSGKSRGLQKYEWRADYDPPELTISFWFRTKSEGYNYLISRGGWTEGYSIGVLSQHDRGGALRAALGGGDPRTPFCILHGTTRIQTGKQYHAAMTFDGRSAGLFLNGVCEKRLEFGDKQSIRYGKTGLWIGGEALGLGNHYRARAPRHFLDGEIRGLVILGRAKSEAEVLGDFQDAIAAAIVPRGWLGRTVSRVAAAFSREAMPEAAPETAKMVKYLTNEELRGWVRHWCDGDDEGLPHISTWNTSKVTDMSWLFSGEYTFNDDISAWDTSNVTNMRNMFWKAKSFNRPLSNWRVDNVTRMDWMFNGALAFNQPLNDWRVDRVTTMSWMFHRASAFNQPLSNWRVDNVRDMNKMFEYASAFDQPLGDWKIRCDCKTQSMFKGTNFRNSRPKKPCCAVS